MSTWEYYLTSYYETKLVTAMAREILNSSFAGRQPCELTLKRLEHYEMFIRSEIEHYANDMHKADEMGLSRATLAALKYISVYNLIHKCVIDVMDDWHYD